ncbi:head GIN domain-containing protein [Spirosoma montaniterrae]|uniref:Putative auto-transporter adhesin head GIN domain-containing protein n=1 Tax=Spirosoma montaniterrae TaxID=1178516 RepID=A0A1P9WY63_9BACT|nr:head GIN domain-containing protein [Spirosoma montaniterrae]AQG80326.1 hypothetical protein AWR27_13960 [Spirosoma montaniterrae]
MKTLALLLVLFVSPFTTANDDWKTDRPVSGFSGLSVSSGIDVYLTQGNSEKLTIEAKGFDEDEVISEVRNGVLKLYIDRRGIMNWNFGRNTYVKAYLTFKQLNNLRASGGADVFGQGMLSFRDLNVEASGGSDIKLSLKANELNAEASGGADLILDGSARSLNASGSGGADLDARKLVVEVGNANSSGGSDVYIHATRELSMKASGGSDIHYYGPAKVLAKSESGGSDITRRN